MDEKLRNEIWEAIKDLLIEHGELTEADIEEMLEDRYDGRDVLMVLWDMMEEGKVVE